VCANEIPSSTGTLLGVLEAVWGLQV
jgi:hypothetical protein